MFQTLIVQPLFNLLVLIYAIFPGHNFGMAIILFTIVIRLLLQPLVKKQLRNAKVMRQIQPELKRIKEETKGDRQRESAMVMELYKERGVNPFSSIGILLVQLPILIGLYAGLSKVIADPYNIISFAYAPLQNLSWMKELAADISKFDMTLFGFIDLKKAAISDGNGVYWPAMFLVLGSAVTQYYQSKQLMPNDKDGRKLRHILRDAGNGQAADSAEVNAAIGRSTKYFIPVLIIFFTVNIASALSLYWLVSGLVAILQQGRILKDDEEEIEAKLHPEDKKPARKKVSSTARVVSVHTEGKEAKNPTQNAKPKTKKSSSKAKSKKRRK